MCAEYVERHLIFSVTFYKQKQEFTTLTPAASEQMLPSFEVAYRIAKLV
jgi:hypothetical protein